MLPSTSQKALCYCNCSMKKTSYPKSQIQVLLLENIHPIACEMLKAEGFSVKTASKALSEKELLSEIQGVHLLGIRSKTKLSAKIFEKADRLKTVGCFCIGTNQVELNAAKLSGIPVFNAPFSNTRSVAEMVLAEIVVLSRQLGDRNTELHKGKWIKTASGCYEIRGKTLGIVGYGHIGSQVSVLAESFGMKVIYYDIASKMPIGNSKSVKSLEDLLKEADFVTFHVPETPQTKKMMGPAQFKALKKGAFVINASRGSVIDMKALRDAIESKVVAGAAIDVFPEEPESNSDPFVSEIQGLPNVFLTPHIGGSTEEAQEAIGVEVATSFIRFMNEGSTMKSVNFPQVDLPVQQGGHRLLNVHKNVPGVLRDINGIISELGANIQAQYLSTDSDIGYLVMDLDKALSEKVQERIRALPTSIKTRILF